jgi:predicted nucleic acid-binding protein
VILWDVNLWVYAFRSDSPLHDAAREESGAERAADGYLFCPVVAASFLRLVTNPKIFAQPSGVDEAGLAAHVTGNGVPDALLASLAIRHHATFVTADRGFGRFQGLECRYLACVMSP